MAKKFLTSIDLSGNQLIRPVLENVSENPKTELAKGRLAFNTTGNVPIVYDGTYWKNLQYEIPAGTYLTENDTITLSGIVTGSGTAKTSITTAIADGALSIAKTTGLQDALNAKMTTASYPSLTAIESLNNTSGILKKTGASTWEIDTSTYLLSDANAVSATKLKTPRAFSIKGGATADAIDFDGSGAVALNVTALDASKLTSTIPPTVLERSTLYVGTTPITLNRPSGALALTGISSIGLGSGNGIKPIIKYKDDDNAIYLTTEVNGALNLHVTGELTTSNILNDWSEYSAGNANWFLSAKLGNDLHTKMENKSNVDHTHTLASLSEKKYDSLTNKPKLGTAASIDTGTSSGNIPILGADGKLNDIVVPKIAISETSVIGTEGEMLALTAEIGDIAIRTDLNKTFILKKNNPNELESWHELFTPTSLVTSVEGRTGAVTLSKTDVGLSNVDNTSDMNKPVSSAQQLALDEKVDKESGKGLISTDEITRLSTVTNQLVPTKLSDLNNDEGFITGASIEDLGGGDMLKSTYANNGKTGYVDKAIDSDTVTGKTVGVNVPADAIFTDTIYEPPSSLPASMITETVERKFVTEAQISAWTSGEGIFPNGTTTQYFRGDKKWVTLDTTVVPEGENLYYTDARVKNYADSRYLGINATALKASELSTAKNFSIGGETGLTAINVPFNGSQDVSLVLKGTLGTGYGGTGFSDPEDGITRKVIGTLTTSATSYPITHSLGSDIIAQVFTSSGELVECDINSVKDKVTFGFNVAPTANSLKYVIIG